MGVPQLWKILHKHGLVRTCGGSDQPEGVVDVASAVHDKVVAVDLSMWTHQAMHQPQLAAAYGREHAALKIVFDRVVNMLRFGVVPIVVLEGVTPDAKQALLDARHMATHGRARASRVGASNAQNTNLQRKARQLLEALGCPVVQAPGEGEAMCAALNAAGYADAVLSFDNDTLLFGAARVYTSMQLLVNNPRGCGVACCEAADVARLLGLRGGGWHALRVGAVLMGGDYEMQGAAAVGGELTLQLLQRLCAGKEDDADGMLDQVVTLLQQLPSAQLAALSSRGCTGCTICGHDCGKKTKRHTSRNPCAECPQQQQQPPGSGGMHGKSTSVHTSTSIHTSTSKKKGGGAVGNESSPCTPRVFESCGCEFHVKSADRWLDKIIRRVQQAPNFMQRMQQAYRAYGEEAAAARAAVDPAMRALGVAQGKRAVWMRRPDVAAVHAVMYGTAEGGTTTPEDSMQQLRRKLLPLLLEWDATHANTPDVEFKLLSAPRMLLHGQDTPRAWRAVGTWQRMPGTAAETVTPFKNSQKGGPTQQEKKHTPSSTTQADMDTQWLSDTSTTPEALSVRLSVLQTTYPGMYRTLLAWQRQQDAARVARKQHGAKAAALARAGAAPGQARLTGLFGVVRRGNSRRAQEEPARTIPQEEPAHTIPQEEPAVAVSQAVAPTTPGGITAKLQVRPSPKGKEAREVIDLCTPEHEEPQLSSPAKKAKTPPRAPRGGREGGKGGGKKSARGVQQKLDSFLGLGK